MVFWVGALGVGAAALTSCSAAVEVPLETGVTVSTAQPKDADLESVVATDVPEEMPIPHVDGDGLELDESSGVTEIECDEVEEQCEHEETYCEDILDFCDIGPDGLGPIPDDLDPDQG